MKASWQEDYFKALIRLRLLLPVNPKAGAQKCDRCHIVARRASRGPLAYKAEMFWQGRMPRRSDRNQLTSADGTKRTCRLHCAMSALRGKAENICSHRAFPVLTQAV